MAKPLTEKEEADRKALNQRALEVRMAEVAEEQKVEAAYRKPFEAVLEVVAAEMADPAILQEPRRFQAAHAVQQVVTNYLRQRPTPAPPGPEAPINT